MTRSLAGKDPGEAGQPVDGAADEAATGAAADLPASRLSLSQRALLLLRAAILDGRLAPGARLVEERLSGEMGMSRVPIREAIKQLVAEGLAVPAEGRGVQVAVLGPDFAQELIEVRAVLEGLNARLAARRADPAIRQRIETALERGDAAIQAQRGPLRGPQRDQAAATGREADAPAPAEELAALNATFHDLMAEAGANRVLQELMRPLRDRTELVFRRNSVERAAEDWREHAMILNAVLDGEEELAALLASRHVHRAARAEQEAPRQPGRRIV